VGFKKNVEGDEFLVRTRTAYLKSDANAVEL
jgi:hypothetical protein